MVNIKSSFPVARTVEVDPIKPEREFVSIEDTMNDYGFSRAFIYKLIEQKAIRTTKVGRRRLVHAPSFRAFLLSRMSNAA